MKFAAMALIATISTIAIGSGMEARLYHFPLGRVVHKHGNLDEQQQRRLQDVDLDALYQARGIQYVQLKVGTPQQRRRQCHYQHSQSRLGFPCLGCHDNCGGEGSHHDAFFLTNQSSTYKEITCSDCKLRQDNVCNLQNQCPVNMYYAEGSSWSGIEVEDRISVGGEDADDEAYRLRFGCQLDVDGLFEDQIPDGIFGMNKQQGSAIKQWTNIDMHRRFPCATRSEKTSSKSQV